MQAAPPTPDQPQRSRIAVVGAGLAGLTAAWLLGRVHQVSVFERQARPGFTAASVSVAGSGGPGGPTVRVDVPLRVFYPGYYPTLTRLYDALGVPAEAVSYATSFLDADGALYFRYRNLRLGRRSWGLPAMQELLRERRARAIVRGALRFQREAVAALRRDEVGGVSIGDYVAALGYPPDFVDGLLLPAICTVCTCSSEQARRFPAAVIIDYLAHGLAHQSVQRALRGADDVERRLLQGIADLRCHAPIAAIVRRHDAVGLLMQDGSEQLFDHVVLATQANQARALLRDAGHGEARVLEGFSYQPVQVLMHRDPGYMPALRRHWSPVNLQRAPDDAPPQATIWVNAVQPALRDAPEVFQTVHPRREPRPEALISRAAFERPVVDGASQRALLGLQALHEQPGRRLWFCGSYAQAGIPLLESAVRSALVVAQRLGAPPI